MNVPRSLSALAATTLLLAGWGSDAQAQAQCRTGTAMPYMVDPTQGLWEVEGPIAAVDTLARTMTVFDAVIEVPATLEILTGDTKSVTLNEFVNPAYEAVRTVIGGTIKAAGNSADPDGDGCINMVATNLFFEFGEHLMVGKMTGSSVDVNNQRLYVHGVPMTMNTDPRIPAEIHDINGNAVLTLDDLLGFEGTMLGPEGYFEGDTLRLVVLETEAYIPNPNGDDAFITVARYETKDEYIRVRGGVDPVGAEYVEVYAPGRVVLNADGTDKLCEGTYLGRAAVAVDPADPAEGAGFDFLTPKGSTETNPETVCVKSQGGGTAYRVFDLK